MVISASISSRSFVSTIELLPALVFRFAGNCGRCEHTKNNLARPPARCHGLLRSNTNWASVHPERVGDDNPRLNPNGSGCQYQQSVGEVITTSGLPCSLRVTLVDFACLTTLGDLRRFHVLSVDASI